MGVVRVVALAGREDRHDEVLDRAIDRVGRDIHPVQGRVDQQAARLEVLPDRQLVLAEPGLEGLDPILPDTQDHRHCFHPGTSGAIIGYRRAAGCASGVGGREPHALRRRPAPRRMRRRARREAVLRPTSDQTIRRLYSYALRPARPQLVVLEDLVERGGDTLGVADGTRTPRPAASSSVA